MNINKINQLIKNEAFRQKSTLSLIASENIASKNIQKAEGSVLSNKYAEGYPGKRYYHGCEIVDDIETLAIEAACKLFKVNYANVQCHSGSQANQAIFAGFLQPGDTILGLNLPSGGHLTHGFKSNLSGKLYNAHFYNVNEYGLLDMAAIKKLALSVKPKLIIAGASSYSRTIDWKGFKNIADAVSKSANQKCYYMADIAHFSGLIAGNAYPSPVKYADFITSTTHKVIRGPRGGLILWNNPEFTKTINSSVFPGIQGGPMMQTIAAKAICFYEAGTRNFKKYALQVVKNAQTMAKVFIDNGYKVISNGTDCHMFVVDTSHHKYDIADLLYENGLCVSKSTLPNLGLSAKGIRIGTPSITSRGLKEKDCEYIAEIIIKILNENSTKYKKEIDKICELFAIK